MFYKTFLDDCKFHVLDLSPKRERLKIYGYTTLFTPMYITNGPIIEEKQRYNAFTTLQFC